MIAKETITRMVDRIADQFHPQKVILFGSHATGCADAQSDLDFLVITNYPAPARQQAIAIRRSLAGFPVACDIIVKSAGDYERSRKVVNHIVYFADRYGRVVYER